MALQPALSPLRTWRPRRQWQVMELSRNVAKVRKHTGLGRCRHFFWLGVVFDTVGATLLFTGVFAHLLFYDLLLYLGSIIIFFSLLWWVFWYTGNIELTPEEESLKRPFDMPFTMGGALSHRFSLTICNMSTTLTRIRRRCGPRTSFLRPASLSMTVTGRLEDQPEKEDQGKDGTTGAQESGDAQNLCSEDLGPKPVGSLEGVRSSGPDAGSLGPETGLPGLVKRSFFTHLEPPEFTPFLPDQAQHPAVLSSRSLPVVPPASTRQPLAVRVSSSQSAASLASTSQPAFIVVSESQPAVPLSSMTQPTVVPASQSQTAASVASQSQPSLAAGSQDHFLVSTASQVHPLVPVPAQSNLQVLLAAHSPSLVSAAAQSHHQVPLSQLENPPSASQTLSSSAQASQLETLATPVSLIQLLSSQPFQTQSVDLRVSLAVQDFQAFYHSQQTVQSISSVQEIAPSQSAPVQEFQKKPVPQAFETAPRAGQELSQEFPATSSPPPESQAPVSQAQQSVSPESTPAPASEKKSLPP